MNILVAGGAGLQGRAVLYDLSRSEAVDKISCVDVDTGALGEIEGFLDMGRIEVRQADLGVPGTLRSLLSSDIDVVIDVTPARFLDQVARECLEAGVSVVNTMYGNMMDPALDQLARQKGLALMPEAGLDPGIDLVLCAHGASQLDEVHELHSLCGGVPTHEAATNALKYKISWSWEGVLWSYCRPAIELRQGRTVNIPADQLHAEEWVETLEFPEVGVMESIANGDALEFVEYLGLTDTVTESTRRTLRWPGHSALWRMFTELGFLSDEPVDGLPGEVTPHDFMLRHLEPRLHYARDEQDLVVMRTIVVGVKDGKPARFTYDLIDVRDLHTGLMAMNRTVGFTASIVAQLIARGEIRETGLLTAVRHIPTDRFLQELEKRGIRIRETVEA